MSFTGGWLIGCRGLVCCSSGFVLRGAEADSRGWLEWLGVQTTLPNLKLDVLIKGHWHAKNLHTGKTCRQQLKPKQRYSIRVNIGRFYRYFGNIRSSSKGRVKGILLRILEVHEGEAVLTQDASSVAC